MQKHRSDLGRLKPDIMLAVPAEQVASTNRRPNATTIIYIVELKFCSDTRHTVQLGNCREQHLELTDRLTKEGYAAHNIKTVPILVGHTGTIYTEHTLEALKKLGITHAHAEKCIAKIHLTAVKQLHSIVCNRRRLEHQNSTPAVHNRLIRLTAAHPRPP